MLGSLALESSAHAAGEEKTLNVALIGCGGRGGGAAKDALMADDNVRLTVMADAFEDHLHNKLSSLRNDKEISAKVAVEPEKLLRRLRRLQTGPRRRRRRRAAGDSAALSPRASGRVD